MAENAITSPASPPAQTALREDDPQLHDLLPFTIADRVFAIFTEQVDGTAEGKSFARLPRAPQGVVGVVCVRGRMLTVLDPAALLNNEPAAWENSLPYVIVLRGDEQLALVAETCRDTITISTADVERPSDSTSSPDGLVLGLVRYGGEEMVLLDGHRLFGRAVQHRERRRRRF